MSWEAYSVAVRIRLTDMVTPALGVISRGMRSLNTDTETAKRNVAELEKRLQSIKGLAITGGVLLGGGAIGLSLFEAPLKAAREYELAFTKFKTLNLGDTVNKQADQFARSANLMGISAKDLMNTMSESVGLFGSFSEAKKLAPKIAALNSANAAIFGGKVEGIDEGGARSLAKFIDRRGGTKDEASFLRNLDLAEKLVTGSGGFLKFRDLDQFSQQGGTAFRGLSDTGILNMAMLLQEQGGARAGTAMMSVYQNLIAGRSTKAAAHAVVDLGLGTMVEQVIGSVGGRPQTRSHLELNPAFAAALQADPVGAIRDFALPAIQRKFGGDEATVLKTLNDMLSNRTASGQASIIGTQLYQVMRDANLTKGAMGYEEVIKAWTDDPNSKFLDLAARWSDTLRELGTVVLPAAIEGVKGLTSGLRTIIEFTQKFPNLTKDMLVMGGGLAALMVVGGAVTLATAGFRTLGLVLGSGGAVAGGGLLGAIAGLLGPIGVAVAGVTALAAIMNLLKPDKKDDGQAHEGEHWERNRSGRGGEWVKNTRVVGAHRGFMGTRENWVPDGAGGGHWETVNTVAPKASGRASQPVVLNMDGRRVGEIVTNHQARAASRPQTNGGGFDSRMQLGASGGW